ncbi:MAG: redoxin domain-containing protein, partial [Firmicutes bacterium]|nr:redoxin domain-containing protein [Bacillota bacterium]
QRFAEKHGLPFILLSDESKKTLQAYDVWKEKTDHGKQTFVTVRTTYLIDETGVIVWAKDKVKAADNPRQMLELL